MLGLIRLATADDVVKANDRPCGFRAENPGHLRCPDQLDELTPREREVMALVATGLSNDEIAKYLVVTRATAKTHVSRALGKLRVRDRAQLVTLAYETGLVLPKKTAAARSSIVTPKLAA